MKKVWTNSAVFPNKKKVVSLEEGVQGVTHLREDLLTVDTQLRLREYPETPL